MWSKFKAWFSRKDEPELEFFDLEDLLPSYQQPSSNVKFFKHPPSGYSTSVRTEPIILPLEFAFVPRFPPKPEGVSDEDFEATLDAIRVALKGNLPDGRLVYYPRQKELYVEFPPEQVHCL
jgi:hypothetical protein